MWEIHILLTVTVKVARSIVGIRLKKSEKLSQHCTAHTHICLSGRVLSLLIWLFEGKNADEVNSNLKQNTMKLALFWS